MDRYGQDYDRSWRGSPGSRERYGADYSGRYGGLRPDAFGEGSYGGMRSDGYGTQSNWRNFPGEEGWYGGASHSRDSRFGGEGYGGGSPRGERGYGAGYYGGYGSPDFESYGGGYGADYRDVVGQRREGFPGQGGERGFGHMAGQQNEGELGRLRAADVMTENPECVTPNATLADAAKKMRDLDVGIIPVVDSDQNRRLRGVITDRDIAVRAVAEGKDIKNTKVSDCMTDEVETVNKNDMVRDVMNVMKREQVRRVPVTDREGRLVGIIAQADVALDITDDHGGAHLFADTVERISEPGHTERSQQSRSRSGSSRTSRSGSSGSSQSNRSSSSKDERGSNE